MQQSYCGRLLRVETVYQEQTSCSAHLTCQCPCLTAQNSGDTPRRFTCCTTAPCSNRKLHTSIFPRPAAAVSAELQRGRKQTGLSEVRNPQEGYRTLQKYSHQLRILTFLYVLCYNHKPQCIFLDVYVTIFTKQSM